MVPFGASRSGEGWLLTTPQRKRVDRFEASSPQVVFSPRKRLQADGRIHDASTQVTAFLRFQGYSDDDIPHIMQSTKTKMSGESESPATHKYRKPTNRFADFARNVGAMPPLHCADDFSADLCDLLSGDENETVLEPQVTSDCAGNVNLTQQQGEVKFCQVVATPPRMQETGHEDFSAGSQSILSQLSPDFCAGLLGAVEEIENRASQSTACCSTPRETCCRRLSAVSSASTTIVGNTIPSSMTSTTSSQQSLPLGHECPLVTDRRVTDRVDTDIDDDVLLPQLRAFQERLKFAHRG